ncbi:MAG: peptidylprolyl isomerase [Rhizobiales bacterium]|nr:peptidylprolyl isomerase [Hyphomicrobiales bacterium]
MTMRVSGTWRAGWALASFVAGVLVFQADVRAADQEVLVKVNGRDITAADVRFAETEIGPQLSSVPERERRRVIVEYLIDNALMSEAGKADNLASGAAFDNRLAYYRERALRDAYFDSAVAGQVTVEQARALYDAQFGAAEGKEEVRARHILVKSEAEANDVIERVNRGDDFAALAGELSIGPSKTQGGDLGYFTRGTMVPAFEEAVFALKAGDVSEPVETQFGWHVIKLEDRRMQQVPAFDDLKDRIMGSLLQRRAEEVLTMLREKANLEFVNQELRKDIEEAARGSFGAQ